MSKKKEIKRFQDFKFKKHPIWDDPSHIIDAQLSNPEILAQAVKNLEKRIKK